MFGKSLKKDITLIELLVVIAIIAILAAILFPVFAQAREKARQASCLSNCKQIGTALILYKDDFDETMPLEVLRAVNVWDGVENPQQYLGYSHNGYTYGCGAGFFFNWYDELKSYVKNDNIFFCPSVKGNVGYGYNKCIGGVADAVIQNTSLKVLCADTLMMPSGGLITWGDVSPWTMYIDLHSQDAGWINAWRHNGGSNYTFCDGHAHYYKRGAGPSDPANGDVNTNQTGAGCKWYDPNVN